jgi:starch synthase
MKKIYKILFVASEAHPLIKTGGLGDVAGSLPPALKAQRHDVRIIMPGYRAAMQKAEKLCFASLKLEGVPETVRLLTGKLPGTNVQLYLVDSPAHFDRPGGPYLDPDGHDWGDNAERFATFAQTVISVALNKAGQDWTPDIVHCNDWQSGLIPALLSLYPRRPATVFTIHNLAYHGHFHKDTFTQLSLPHELWGIGGLEFYDGLSFIKGGLAFADMLNTVSPTYAEEIRTPAFGHGMDGLINHRGDRLRGILNGADYKEWDSTTDPHLAAHFDARHLNGKATNKQHLQKQFGLPQDPNVPLLATVGRLAEQKGVDLIMTNLPRIIELGAQIVIVGSGDKALQKSLQDFAKPYPSQMGVFIGFNEALAHQVEAGADMFLMPSRFEPCGLNQIYSLRYGTVPVVRHTGGLADTVVDASEENFVAGAATGFLFEHATPEGLGSAIERAVDCYRHQPQRWRSLITNGMKQDFSWRQSAKHYLDLYAEALAHRDRAIQTG